jgi:hypothetical protein
MHDMFANSPSFGVASAHGTESHADEIMSLGVTSRTVPTAAVSQPSIAGCPTVTETRELCSTCILPACIIMSTLTLSCECPDAVPTVFLDFPCDGSGCAGASCSTAFDVVAQDGTCRPVASVTDYLDTPVIPMPTFGADNSTASEPSATGSSSSSITAPPESSPSETAPPVETVSGNAAGRMVIPFAGWF